MQGLPHFGQAPMNFQLDGEPPLTRTIVTSARQYRARIGSLRDSIEQLTFQILHIEASHRGYRCQWLVMGKSGRQKVETAG
jgi:hypothetical protein